MLYQQTLWKVVEPIKLNTIHRLNKSKSWKYGYNKEHDVVVISKTGKIGEIQRPIEIALPALSGSIKFCHVYTFQERGQLLVKTTDINIAINEIAEPI